MAYTILPIDIDSNSRPLLLHKHDWTNSLPFIGDSFLESSDPETTSVSPLEEESNVAAALAIDTGGCISFESC